MLPWFRHPKKADGIIVLCEGYFQGYSQRNQVTYISCHFYSVSHTAKRQTN